jgi:hypothetical protein
VGGESGFNSLPFGVIGQFFDNRNGYHDDVFLWPMPFHNPSISVNALNRHGRLRWKLRGHHQPATVIKQGCIHSGSFPRTLRSVKPGGSGIYRRRGNAEKKQTEFTELTSVTLDPTVQKPE